MLAWPKPTFEQLVIELPCLMGFRASEVCTWRAEYIDFKHGNTLVLDAKKKRLFIVPLNVQVAAHAEQLLNGRGEGYVLRNRSRAWRGRVEPLNPASIWRIWKKWAFKLNLYPTPEDYSPVVGRRWFAAYWYHYLKLSLITLQMIMRHTDWKTTLEYVEHLVFYEDLVKDYKQFQFSFIQKDVKSAPNVDELKQLLNDFFISFNQKLEVLKQRKGETLNVRI